FYGPDEASPLGIVARKGPEAGTAAFAQELASTAKDLLGLVPDRDAGVLVVAAPPPQNSAGGAEDSAGPASAERS
ncbi:MAG TPA: hypothetical protein DFR83_29195, partial [Deltaproteobacteria bacterium]|nr:hypothetical protein [Deltaproteobacteria bacterium]